MTERTHPLYRISALIGVGVLVGWLALDALRSSPALIEPLELRCSPTEDERHAWRDPTASRPHLETPKSSRAQRTRETWRVISWDLSELKGEMGEEAMRHEVTPFIQSALQSEQTPENHPQSSLSSSPLVVMLQGVSDRALSSLSEQLSAQGGCWVSAELSATSQLGRSLERAGVNVYQAVLGPEGAPLVGESRHLWIGIYNAGFDVSLHAERWSLPGRPGRWPQRWFYERPAALVVEVKSGATSRRLLNLRLPDALQKHQAGALALKALQQPPLSDRLGAGWLIAGDWRVTPPQTPKHPKVGFRFQRFSIAALYQDSKLQMYPALDVTPQEWGRWRSSALDKTPAIIDHALTDLGSFTHWGGKPRWVGDREQRAPLTFKWVTSAPSNVQ